MLTDRQWMMAYEAVGEEYPLHISRPEAIERLVALGFSETEAAFELDEIALGASE